MGFLHSQFFKTPFLPKGDFTGKTVVITGGNTGLGKEAARHYACMGVSRLILAVRSLDKGHAAKKDIQSSITSCHDIHVWELDMASYDSVQKFAKRLDAELDRVDIFIANAGVARAQFSLIDEDEETIRVNVFSTFLLAALVMPKMKDTAARFNTRPTFTVTGSEVYSHTTFPQRSAPYGEIFTALSEKETAMKTWDMQYPNSKIIELWVVRAICERHQGSEFPVTINIVNPGLCHSELARDSHSWGFQLFKLIVARSTELGSRTLVHAGASGAGTHGKYLSDCEVEEPEPLVTSEEGREVQDQVSAELMKKLESIVLGVTRNFRP